MITSKNLLTIAVSLILVMGCSSMKLFTSETQPKYSFTDDQLMAIQYFISSPVTLQLQEKRIKSKVTKDNQVDSKKVHYRKDLIIDEETPGIASKLEEGLITINFADDIALGFSPVDSISNGAYMLSTFNGQDITNKSEVTYKDKSWVIRFGKPGSKFLGLFYDADKFDEQGVPSLLYKLMMDDEKEYKAVVLKGKELK